MNPKAVWCKSLESGALLLLVMELCILDVSFFCICSANLPSICSVPYPELVDSETWFAHSYFVCHIAKNFNICYLYWMISITNESHVPNTMLLENPPVWCQIPWLLMNHSGFWNRYNLSSFCTCLFILVYTRSTKFISYSEAFLFALQRSLLHLTEHCKNV